MNKKPNFIATAKTILDEEMRITPELTTRQARLLCFAMRYTVSNLGDDEVMEALQKAVPGGDAEKYEAELSELQDAIGGPIYGPRGYRG